ncbi:hypothetical protein Cgig2_019901 [Carnegiea gigantea]|uniref:Gnk2-homologous domain-containing protein n=1 Tax=Carnegiea gigantea TaxID=171969 RepID=A0A9Q1QIY2_9CARY|nr:hypothetical protein Cgig2_019901 [Carnegiea gigantea]
MAQLHYFAIITVLLITLSPCSAEENSGSQCVYSSSTDAPCSNSTTNLISEKCDHKSAGNYTHDSAYESNLLSVLSNLTSAAASTKAFYNASAGSGEDQVFGLFYCRGDVHPNRCLSCVETGVSHLKTCSAREGSVYYELCTIRYAKRAIFGSVELKQDYISCGLSAGPKSPNLIVFNQTVDETAARLIEQVTSGNSSSYFATEAAKLYKDQRVYMLVQCSPDLTLSRCDDCLSGAWEVMSLDCWGCGYIWGMYFQPSCQLRYDVVPFFNLTVHASSPPSIGSSPPSIGSSPKTSNRPEVPLNATSDDLQKPLSQNNISQNLQQQLILPP